MINFTPSYIRKNIFILFIFLTGAFLYCEYVHYFVVIMACQWYSLNSKYDTLHLMALADTHLLGSRNGHWFDKLRREWQMYRAFQTALVLHKPDAVVFLGDLFDEGKWCSEEEFSQYIDRFRSLFQTPKDVDVLITAGNHDIGFHYSSNLYLLSRFEDAFNSPSIQMKIIKGVVFVLVNSVAMHGDDCHLCRPARKRIKSIARKLKCSKNRFLDECAGIFVSDLVNHSAPVILQHYPLYRDSDARCLEIDSAPIDIKDSKFREKWECLSYSSTQMLLTELQPRLILSGHTHHGCRLNHTYTLKPSNQGVPKSNSKARRREGTDASEEKKNGEDSSRRENEVASALEYTVSSFSWRNKVNPTFAMVSISPDDYKIYKCEIPNENTVILMYSFFALSAFLYLFSQRFRTLPFSLRGNARKLDKRS